VLAHELSQSGNVVGLRETRNERAAAGAVERRREMLVSVAIVMAPASLKASTMSTRWPVQVKRTTVTTREGTDTGEAASGEDTEMLRLLIRLVMVALGVWLALALYLFVWPSQDHPRHAAAVIVLSGDAQHRFPRALALAERASRRCSLSQTEPVRTGLPPGACVLTRVATAFGSSASVPVLIRPRRGAWRPGLGPAKPLALAARGHVDLPRIPSAHALQALLRRTCRVYATGTRSSLAWLPVNAASETFKLGLALTLRRGC